MSCAQCAKRLPGPGEFGSKVGTCGQWFCSVRCADKWMADPANAEARADADAKAACPAYVDCFCASLMADIQPARPAFAACDALCPLRASGSAS